MIVPPKYFSSLPFIKASSINQNKEWRDYPEVNSKQLQMLIDHFIDTSYKLNLFDKDNAKKILVRIKRMFTRLKPDKMEGNFLRGFLTRINKKIK